ncbi:MAG: DUF480 domain-containing protein [Gemmataceae bacterium]|nr:DUF480 domain-containing protein [Gemmataceae bacterium]
MSNAEPSAESWPVLPIRERRVLGVLIEKQKTSKSPDAYPMSVNAITTGCNQKSNRDPVLDLDEDDVEETLTRLQGGGWVSKITGGRVERWRHLLYENWKVGRVELAILAELLLRGPQSEGDLRTRVCRMDDVPDLDQLRALLKPLAERKLVVYLTPPERRGTTLTHGFHAPEELQAAAAAVGRGAVESPAINVEGRSSLAEEVGRLRDEVRELREWVLELRDARPS